VMSQGMNWVFNLHDVEAGWTGMLRRVDRGANRNESTDGALNRRNHDECDVAFNLCRIVRDGSRSGGSNTENSQV